MRLKDVMTRDVEVTHPDTLVQGPPKKCMNWMLVHYPFVMGNG